MVTRAPVPVMPAFSWSSDVPLLRITKPRSVTSGAEMVTTSPWPPLSITGMPWPSSITGLSISRGPAYVPGGTRIVSPGCAAAIAACKSKG